MLQIIGGIIVIIVAFSNYWVGHHICNDKEINVFFYGLPYWYFSYLYIHQFVLISVSTKFHGLPSPVRNANRVTQSIFFAGGKTSYKSVYCDFLGLEDDNTLRAIKYDAFCELWHQLIPRIHIMSPRTDLCDTCQRLRNDLQFKSCKEGEAQGLLKRYKEHLAKAKLERKYYNTNTKLAEQQDSS